jgi:outer membrane protein OmpA-like peptidoglycan-associated protein
LKWLLLTLLTFGCGTQLRERSADVGRLIERARNQGAYRCAPRELAMAVSHNDFARAELDAGEYYHALDEVEIADRQAQLALAHSPPDRCAPPIKEGPHDADGDGIVDTADHCPYEPEDKDGFEDEDGCPDPDNDKDGIVDKNDKCPNEPEDFDQFEDQDGCPDPDNDRDGIADGADRCPNEAGSPENGGCPDKDKDGDGVIDRLDRCPDLAGDKDNEGCPKQKLVRVTKEKIELLQKVHFATAKATIMPDSFAMLTEVADVLKQRPDIKVRVEGHTDKRGGLAYNMKLSQSRADSVKLFLVGQGIAPERMESRGFGPTQAISDNRTEKGREQNRRVEFIITAQ